MSKTDKVLINFVRFGVFLTPFIVFIVSGSMLFPFITGKGFFFRILIEILGFAWILLLIRGGNYSVKKSNILSAVAIFILILGVADLFGANSSRSFWSNYERMEGYITYLHLFVYFLILGSVLNEGKWWDRFWHTFLGAGAYAIFYGLLQFYQLLGINQAGPRVDATFGNSSYLAGFMIFILFFSIFYLVRNRDASLLRWVFIGIVGSFLFASVSNSGAMTGRIVGLNILFLLVASAVFYIGNKSRWIRLPYLVIALFSLAVILLSGTRGAIVGVLLATAITTLIFILKGEGNLKRVSLGILVGLVFVGGIFYLSRNSRFIQKSQVLSRLGSISLQERTMQSRFMVWGMALRGFRDRPVLGWGQENFNLVFNSYYNPKMWPNEPWFDRAHNVFFDWLISAGLPGLLSYLSLFGLILWYIWFGKSKSLKLDLIERGILTGLFVAYFVHNFFVFDNLISYLLFWGILAFIHSRYSEGELFKHNLIENVGEGGRNIIIGFVSVALVFLFYFGNIKPISASTYIIQGLSGPYIDLDPSITDISIIENTRAGYSFDAFGRAIGYKTFGSVEAREHLSQYAMSVANNPHINSDLKERIFRYSKSEIEEQIKETPNDVRYKIFLSAILNQFGFYKETIKNNEEAEMLSPGKQSISFVSVSAYINLRMFEEAESLAKRVFEIETENFQARLIYAIAAIYNNHVELAESLLGDKKEEVYATDDRFMQTFNNVGNFKKLVDVWRVRLDRSPDDQNIKLALAASLSASGEKGKAISLIREIISLNPDFRGQGEHYIQQIQSGADLISR